MNYAEAVRLLQLVRDGADVPGPVIEEALFLTGDGPCPGGIPDPDIEEFVAALRQEGVL